MATRRVALVTGSGKRRVGSFVAEELFRRGYALVIHYLRSVAEAEEAARRYVEQGGEAVAVGADLSDEDDVRRMIDTTLGDFGRLDVLVNCAAVWQRRAFEDVTAEDVRRHFDANLLGTFLTSRHAGMAMVRQPEGGCIVNVGDWACVRPYLDHAAYFASKGAIPTLTRTLAVELGTRNSNVRVNCVLPGPVMLPADLPEEERREAINATLVKREGRPENVAHAVLFFLENDFVTGACLPVDGGRSVYAP